MSGDEVIASVSANEEISVPALVMYAFWPLMTQPLSVCRARVVKAAVSEPACGSVPASAPKVSPRTIPGR